MTRRDLGPRGICPPDHKHAQSLACYTAHRCGCIPCREHNAAHRAEASRLKAYGRWTRGRFPVAQVTVHILSLQRFGYTYEQIARVADVDARTVYRAANRHVTYLHGRAAHAILAVTPTITDLDPGTLIDARGARRRIQALAARGWSFAATATVAGLPNATTRGVLTSEKVTVRTHLAIAAAYDQIAMERPSEATTVQRRDVTRAKRIATAAGWAPPLAWDDTDTDDAPQTADDVVVLVDEIAVELATRGEQVRLTREERHIALRQLHAGGHSDKVLAHMLGVSDQTILRDRGELGLPANEYNPVKLGKAAA